MRFNTRDFFILIIVTGLVIVVMTAVQLVLSLDAVKQRNISASRQNEIICILKIQPAERQAHPERVEACKGD